ncbi:Uu.00g103740.m01.CDS01 [Anthostomella pinea]|uniref:Uu.00g103740.m01.CDS01 n=1 Tax=Anthostomella pinea TaxID=933095 RepID=A0AAI8YD81_9PEZI|nr:Uu.00g103740.m01.CDS01 [Anthostomella pinea]
MSRLATPRASSSLKALPPSGYLHIRSLEFILYFPEERARGDWLRTLDRINDAGGLDLRFVRICFCNYTPSWEAWKATTVRDRSGGMAMLRRFVGEHLWSFP